MELLYGTTNPGKLDAMSRALAPLGLTLVGLRGLGLPIPAVEEEGNTILENAEQKARAYSKAFGRGPGILRGDGPPPRRPAHRPVP